MWKLNNAHLTHKWVKEEEIKEEIKDGLTIR